MGFWNEWLREREKAPLDHLRDCLQTKWQAAHDLCLDDCCEHGQKIQEQKQLEGVIGSSAPASDMANQAMSKLPEPLEPAPSAVVVAEKSPEISEASSAMPHANQCCQCKKAQEDVKVENVDYERLPVTARSSANQPLREQEGCARANDQASDEQAQLQRTSAFSKSPRIAEASVSLMSKGAKVEVWSNSKQEWCPGLVLDFFEVEGRDGGFKVPAGSYKVSYAGNTIKWIKGECVQDLLRPIDIRSTL